MKKYIAKRLLFMIPTLFGITLLVFFLMYITPGDPVKIKLGENITEEVYESMRLEMGLDDPFFVQFGRYVSKLLKGDMGASWRTNRSVWLEISSRYPTSIKLALLCAAVAIVVGVFAGVISAIRQYSILDSVITGITLFSSSAPSFWIALMLILLFSIKLRWLPSSGTYGPKYWIMPVAVLGLQQGAMIMRMTRTAMLDVIRQDYIVTARAKGQKESVIIIRHALRNAMIPITTSMGIVLCNLLGGQILVESVFSIPGIGKFMMDSLSFRDRPSVQGCVLVIGFMAALINLLVDLTYGLIDPRISLANKKKKETKTADEQKSEVE